MVDSITCTCVQTIPYSLKFTGLKFFADFAGQSKATKIFSHKIFSSSLMLGVAGSSTAEICCFFFRIWLKREIFTPQKV